MKPKLTLLIIAFYLTLITIVCYGEDGASGNIVFSGTATKLEVAASKADLIFVGRVITLGPIIPSEKNAAFYAGAKIAVSERIKGQVPAEATVTFKVKRYANEHTPTEGIAYIFFAKEIQPGGKIDAFKLIAGTEENIRKVKALIASAPAEK